MKSYIYIYRGSVVPMCYCAGWRLTAPFLSRCVLIGAGGMWRWRRVRYAGDGVVICPDRSVDKVMREADENADGGNWGY